MKRKSPKPVIALLFALIIIYPFIYALSASFFSARDFTSSPARLLPSTLDLKNYIKVLQHRYFLTYIVNSIITSIAGTLLRSGIAYIASYAFAFYRFKGSRIILGLLLGTLFIPGDILLAENYILIQRLGLLDTYLGIISTGLLSASMIFMLRQFFLSVPSTLHDSASIDGANDFSFSVAILLPISKAVISALMLQSFVSFFNNYLWPLLVTNKPRMRTIQVGITMLGYSESLNYGPLFAAIIIILVPFVILFTLMRKRIMEALKNGYMHI